MNAQEIAALVDRHGPPLVLYARQRCSMPEDVVQEAFLKLVTQSRWPSKVIPWLYRVVRNAARDLNKSQYRRQQRERSVARATRWFVEPEIEGLDAEVAVAALHRLPIDQREVIVARLWGGLSFEVIGEIAGCSASTAFRRLEAGIDALRKELRITCQNPTSKS